MSIEFLRPLLAWIDSTSISRSLQASTYTFSIVEAVHLLALTIFVGTQAAVSLRLLGYGMKRPASEIYDGLAAWSRFGVILVALTGLTMVVGEPIKLSANEAFPYKVLGITTSAVIYFTGYLRLVKPGRAEASPILAKLVAVSLQLSLLGAGVAGRSIGFV